VRFVSISGEEDFATWKQYSGDEELNKFIPQYNNKKIYEEVGLKYVPSIILIDRKGIIQFLGVYKDLEFTEAIKNLCLEKEEEKIKLKATEVDILGKNPNEWWIDMDAESKVDIVRNINLSLRELGSNNAQFLVLTKYTYEKDNIKTYTIPFFKGTMFEAEYEILQVMAIDLQSNWNFNNFSFECQVLPDISSFL